MHEGQLLLKYEPRKIYLGDNTSDYDSEKDNDDKMVESDASSALAVEKIINSEAKDIKMKNKGPEEIHAKQ